VVLLLFLDMQSLVDVAQKEAERRRLLEEQGIEGKVIVGNGTHLAPNGNITTSTGPPLAPVKKNEKSDSPKNRASVRSYQTSLKKLDREIRQTEERLASRRERLQAEKWAPLKIGRSASRSRTKNSQNQLQKEIDELQIKLRRLREERFEVYEAGKKAGFLPGELEGKGIIP
jgi:chromosome segregation ATPase